MFDQTLAIIRNTFFESIRQPIMLVVLVAASVLIIMCNPLSAFTMEDDQRMLIDMGMAMVFVSSTLLAAFIATNVLGREIDNRTVLTVVAKPVSRPIFVIGKYIGVAAAITLGTAFMALVFLLVEQHSVMQTTRDPYHLPSIFFGIGAAVIGVGVGVWCNYFYNKVFASTMLCVTTPLLALAYLLTLLFQHDFTPQPIGTTFRPQILLAMVGLLLAVLIISAIAIAASTRLGQVMTLCITLGVFLLGMLSDWIFGRKLQQMREAWTETASAQGLTEMVEKTVTVHMKSGEIEQIVQEVEVPTVPFSEVATIPERLEYFLFWLGHAVVPNFQALWLTDALTQGHLIPVSYVFRLVIYAAVLITVTLAVAILLFQRREVG
jgi:ABC-type transport system involved in multi-copper enzyme maturation permease subunit